MHDSLVILLHGVGASGSDLAPLGDALRPHLPRTRFASPDAPGRSEHGPGRQWFSVAGVSQANRPQRIEAARAEFDRVLNAQISSLGFSDRLERVALVGFSQGSIMALDALVSGRCAPGAIVAFSGRLASRGILSPTRQAAAKLRELGVHVETHVFPGLGHTISSEGVARAGEFLARSFASGEARLSSPGGRGAGSGDQGV